MKICYFLSHYVSHRQAGLQYIDCLEQLGVEIVSTPADADLVVIHNEPWSIAGYFRAFPELHQRRVIAYAVWETDRLPEHYRFNLSLAAELWTPSSYCRDVLAQAERPVSIVPHVVNVPPRNPEVEQKIRERIGARDGEFLFYTIANAGNVRKGIGDLLAAFKDTFAEGEARLVIKSNGPLPAEMAAVPGVVSIAGMLGDDEIAALHRVGDCFVSAHRSEGWGLGISDAMACGNLVVATAHGGNMDYMNEANSLPVACSIEPIRADEIKRQPDLLTPDMRWAYVDPEDLRRQLRRAFDERESLGSVRAQAARDMERYAPKNIAARLEERLAAMQGTMRVGIRPAPAPSSRP